MRKPSEVGSPVAKLLGDLRERRLLPVIAILVVAIGAVPFVLRSSPAATPPPPAAAPLDKGAEAAVPAVLVDNPGVRDYRQRLRELQSKNPFADHFSLPKSAVKDVGGISEAPQGSVPDVGNPDTGIPPADSTVPPAGSTAGDTASSTPPADTSTTPTDPGGSTGSGGDGTSAHHGTVHTKFYELGFEVDLEFGRLGEAVDRNGTEQYTVLPSDSRPVVYFAGVTPDRESAIFLVSDEVSGTGGAGACFPNATDCQVLHLKAGERRRLVYEPASGVGGGPYTLKLTAIHIVVLDKRDSVIPKNAQSSTGPSGVDGWFTGN